MHDRAVYNDAGRAIRLAARACEPSLLNKAQNLEFFNKARAVAVVDSFLRPYAYVQIPQWTVVSGNC